MKTYLHREIEREREREKKGGEREGNMVQKRRISQQNMERG